MNKFLTKDDVAAVRAAKKVLKKLQRKIDKLQDIRKECDKVKPVDRTAANGAKWKKATEELYDIEDELVKAGLSTVECLQPDSDYLMIAYQY